MSAGFALPRDAGRRPALRFARQPGWEVVGNSRWQGAASWRWFRAPARCRSETGAPFARQPGWEVVGNSRWQGAASSALVSRSRAMPVGGRRSLACAPLCPVGARRNRIFHSKRWCGTHGGRARVMRAGFALPRDADRRSAFPGLRAAPGCRPGALPGATAFSQQEVVGTHGGRAASLSAGFALPRDAGRRPALRRAPAGMGCGGECTLVGRRVIGAGFALPRVPTGGRRSLACAPLCPVGARRNCISTARGGVALTGAGRSVIGAGFALPRDAGRRPALHAVPALVVVRQYAVSRPCGPRCRSEGPGELAAFPFIHGRSVAALRSGAGRS